MMSDAETMDNPSRPGMKQQGMAFLMMRRSTRELLAAASSSEAGRHQHVGLMAVQAAVGMMMAVRTGEAGQFTNT